MSAHSQRRRPWNRGGQLALRDAGWDAAEAQMALGQKTEKGPRSGPFLMELAGLEPATSWVRGGALLAWIWLGYALSRLAPPLPNTLHVPCRASKRLGAVHGPKCRMRRGPGH